MPVESRLLERIFSRKATLTFLGLGHVGLPTAVAFSRAGFQVTGVDTNSQRVRNIALGKSNIRELGLDDALVACLDKGGLHVTCDSYQAISTSDFVSVCVPTPVDKGKPDMRNFHAALNAVKEGAHRSMMMLIESTVPPSTTSGTVAPELRSLGYTIDEDIFLAYCPERLAPSRALEEFASNTRVIGGIGPKSQRVAAELYKTVCRSVEVTDALTAELSKVAENTFRDLNIAYANLLALTAENLGTDINEVIRLANTHPRVSILKPGLGVGGPCLPKDPYLLMQHVPEPVRDLLGSARKINDEITGHVVDMLSEAIGKGAGIEGRRIAILGVTYKPDTEDVTNSPARVVIEALAKAGACLCVYDPYSSETYGAERVSSVDEALDDADCVVIATGHTVFKSIDPDHMRHLTRSGCTIFDGPRILDAARTEAAGLRYLGVGYGAYKWRAKGLHDKFAGSHV
jgi:UDP-N-acetyl-D-mannosaminuronic acid dehydrogenase